jgi:hypothetical protein
MRISRALAGLAVSGAMLAGGYVAGHVTAERAAATVQACPAPAYPGQNAGYVTAGSRIIGTNGGNAIAPGDVYICDASGNGYVTK